MTSSFPRQFLSNRLVQKGPVRSLSVIAMDEEGGISWQDRINDRPLDAAWQHRHHLSGTGDFTVPSFD
jgi:hypothetical protein